MSEIKKPRILIAMHYMELGGAESALLGLLQAHDPERADIDLFLYDHRGELMEYIPTEKINLLPQIPVYAMMERPLKDLIKQGYWGIALGRLCSKILVKLERGKNVEQLDDISVYYYIAKCVSPFLPKINPLVEYDLGISFLQPHQFVLDKVRAKKKLAWVHTDYSKVYVSQKEEHVWGSYDYIGAISEEVGAGFVRRFPSLKDKIFPIENILSSAFIRQRAQSETIEFPQDSLNLLTIGRYSYPKKLDEVPAITRKLLTAVPNLRWYIIGYGAAQEEVKIMAAIEQEGMQEHVFLLGKQSNPYPYIQACDIYVQPSRYEGKSITVREAQILQKPVIVTNYPTAKSQIQDGLDGVIVPLEVSACAAAMIEFLQNNEKQEQLSRYLSEHDYGNEKEIEKLYTIVPL